MLLSELFVNAVTKFPKRIAIESDYLSISYSELYLFSKKAGNYLVNMDIKTGERVALIGKPCPDLLIAEIGCILAGIIPIMIPHSTSEEQMFQLLNNLEPKCIIYTDEYISEMNKFRLENENVLFINTFYEGDYISIQEIINRDKNYINDLYSFSTANSPAIIIFTTGTTGIPKGVIHTHSSILSWMGLGYDYYLEIPVRRIVSLLAHVSGQFALWSSIKEGSCLVFPSKEFSGANELLDFVEEKNITNLGLLGGLLRDVVFLPGIENRNLNSLKMITFGGMFTPIKVIKRAMDIFPKTGLSQGYGSTESGLFITAMFPHYDIKLGEEKLNSVGSIQSISEYQTPLSIKIVNEFGIQVKEGDVGEVICKGPQNMHGYWNNADDTASKLINGWVYTGDYALMDEEGYVYLKDRKDDIIQNNKNRIYSIEIERVLSDCPNVWEVAVVGGHSKEIGIYLVPFRGKRIELKIINEKLESILRESGLVWKIVTMDKLPRKVGRPNKIDKVLLKKFLNNG